MLLTTASFSSLDSSRLPSRNSHLSYPTFLWYPHLQRLSPDLKAKVDAVRAQRAGMSQPVKEAIQVRTCRTAHVLAAFQWGGSVLLLDFPTRSRKHDRPHGAEARDGSTSCSYLLYTLGTAQTPLTC